VPSRNQSNERAGLFSTSEYELVDGDINGNGSTTLTARNGGEGGSGSDLGNNGGVVSAGPVGVSGRKSNL
jgi:hypothetical protein